MLQILQMYEIVLMYTNMIYTNHSIIIMVMYDINYDRG